MKQPYNSNKSWNKQINYNEAKNRLQDTSNQLILYGFSCATII